MTTTASALQTIFSSYGTIISLRLPLHRVTQEPRGKAFISFTTPSEARAALSHGGRWIDGKRIEVNLAKSRAIAPQANPAEHVDAVGDDLDAFMDDHEAAVITEVVNQMDAMDAAHSTEPRTTSHHRRSASYLYLNGVLTN